VLGGISPVPGVLERLDLRVRLLAGRRAEQDVVVGLAVERRIEIDQINRLVLDVLAQDFEIVALVQDALFHRR
jgi:hypothetical protein